MAERNSEAGESHNSKKSPPKRRRQNNHSYRSSSSNHRSRSHEDIFQPADDTLGTVGDDAGIDVEIQAATEPVLPPAAVTDKIKDEKQQDDPPADNNHSIRGQAKTSAHKEPVVKIEQDSTITNMIANVHRRAIETDLARQDAQGRQKDDQDWQKAILQIAIPSRVHQEDPLGTQGRRSQSARGARHILRATTLKIHFASRPRAKRKEISRT